VTRLSAEPVRRSRAIREKAVDPTRRGDVTHPISPVITHSTYPGEGPMYDMYPDWGPASHNPENPRSHEAVQASLDLRDNGGEPPDDN
jgi:hypothetical protein